MIKIPYVIAKRIVLNQMHPVAAWREYYGMSQQMLAEYSRLRIEEIIQIENSNQHLQADYLKSLSEVFGIYPQVLNIRYNSYN